MTSTNNKPRIYINEVVTRDGFQSEKTFIPTEKKIEFINKLSKLNYGKIEVTSFVSPKAIPALADALEVLAGIERSPHIQYTALIPNIKGMQLALGSTLDEVNLVMSVSESHNQSNLRRSRELSLSEIIQMADMAETNKVGVNVSLSTAFGCPFEGSIQDDQLFWIIDSLVDNDISNMTLCDTTGVAYPALVDRVLTALKQRYGELNLTMHFHNTRGMGLVNGLTALKHGVISFDSSLGELGGCPYAPGATGNVCSEELAYLFELNGYDTALDITNMLELVVELEEIIGRPVPSLLAKAGLIKF